MIYKTQLWFLEIFYRWSLRKLRCLLKSKHKYEVHAVLTDHALLRYIERNGLVDVEAIRKLLLSRPLYDKVKEIGGNGRFTLQGITYVCVKGRIVTAYQHQPGSPTKVINGKRVWEF